MELIEIVCLRTAIVNFQEAQNTKNNNKKRRLLEKAIDSFEKSGLASLYTPGNLLILSFLISKIQTSQIQC
jgi:hypothetical protein